MVINKKLIFVFIILLISLSTYSFFYWQGNFFALSPDSAGLTCGIEQITDNQTLGVEGKTYENFDTPVCWEAGQYPTNQIIHFDFSSISGLDIINISPIVTILIACLIPLLIFLICDQLFKNSWFSFVGGMLAVFAVPLARSLTLTPHNLFGFLFILLIIYSLIRLSKEKGKWPHLVYIFICLIALAFVHQLSLAIIFIPLVLYLLYFLIKEKKWPLIIVLIIAAVGISILASWFFTGSLNPLNLTNTLLEEAAERADLGLVTAHPWWDNPAAIGYLLFGLGAIGFFVMLLKNKNPIKIFLALFLLITLIVANAHYLGFEYLNYRFLAYAFIPLIIFSVFAIEHIFEKLKSLKLKSVGVLIIILIVLASGVHFFKYAQDDFNGFSQIYLPSQDFTDAVSWLNQNAQLEDTLLLTSKKDNRQASFAPVMFDGNVIIYPLLYFKHLGEFEIDDNIEYERQIFKDNGEKTLKGRELYSVFLMLTQPTSTQALNLMDNKNVEYILVAKGSHENQIFADATSEFFPKIYENESLIIYKNVN